MSTWDAVERFFAWLLQTSGYATVIVFVVLLAQWLLRHRLSPAWRYGLWILLIARLLMPMTLRSAVSIFNLARWAPSRMPALGVAALPAPYLDTAPQTAERPSEIPSHPGVPSPRVEAPPPSVRTAPTIQPALASVKSTPAKSTDWTALATGFWVSGVLILGLRFVWIEHRFRRRLARYAPVKDESFLGLLHECARLLRVKDSLSVFETDDIETPAVYGLWRKRLLLPDGLRESLSQQGLRHVLLHELAHIKRRDPELNWLLLVLQILHWFNPVLWFAFGRMRADRELATDDLALAHTGPGDRHSYGETILQVLEGLTQRSGFPGLVGIGESKAQIKQRIRAIARGGGPRWGWAAGAAAIVIAGIALTNAREDSPTNSLDLLKRYPTTLTVGDSVPGRARPWQFTPDDIFQVSHFELAVGRQLKIEAGMCDLGIGHCADGAVWAVLLPRDQGKLTSSAASTQEAIAHVWLRFHPAEIGHLFAPDAVSFPGQVEAEEKIRRIVEAKLSSSWHAGNRVMIPEPKDLTVDVDTKGGPRRFFVVDTKTKTAEYVAAFADRGVEPSSLPADGQELDTNRASVVSVMPQNEGRDVEAKQQLRIRFDRPMNPYNFKLGWLAGGFQLAGPIQVSPDRREFTVPVQLAPGDQQLVLNRDQERERWIALGRRPEMKPSGSSRAESGFVDDRGIPANEFRWRFSTRTAAPKGGASKPRVVSVSPPSGSTSPVLTPVEITFDQPMRPPGLALPYLQKGAFSQGPSLIPSVEYDSAARRFTIPALLRVDDDIRLTIRGFYSADGVACDPVVLHYQTGTESLDSSYLQRAKAAAHDPQLQKLLTSMKQARARLKSGIETVQSIRLNAEKNSFNTIEAQTATFKWQADGRVYADISGPMSVRAFILGSNGQDDWLYSENEKGEKRLDRTQAGITQKEVFLVDPFTMESRSVDEALAGLDLVQAGSAKLEGRSCRRLEKWEVDQENGTWATLTQWWIDDQTFLPAQIIQYYPAGCQIVRFEYSALNQPISSDAFEPPTMAANNARPLFFQNAPEAGERRFFRISDGSNGRMSGRIGWHGPKGTTSSGLN